MIITKHHYKILKYVCQNSPVTYSCLKRKFKGSLSAKLLSQLVRNQYLEQLGGSVNNYGEPIPIKDSTAFELTDKGIVEVERRQWFNPQFVLLQIILPIIIAIITTLITIFLTALLSPSL